jgi:hypothetical protein
MPALAEPIPMPPLALQDEGLSFARVGGRVESWREAGASLEHPPMLVDREDVLDVFEALAAGMGDGVGGALRSCGTSLARRANMRDDWSRVLVAWGRRPL